MAAFESRTVDFEGIGVVCFFYYPFEGLLLANVAYYRPRSYCVAGLPVVTQAPLDWSRLGLTENCLLASSWVLYFMFDDIALLFSWSRLASDTGMPWKLLTGFCTDGWILFAVVDLDPFFIAFGLPGAFERLVTHETAFAYAIWLLAMAGGVMSRIRFVALGLSFRPADGSLSSPKFSR
jgi:hypothetical protein